MEINRQLTSIKNVISGWGETAGATLALEPLMRWIVELSEPAQIELARLVKMHNIKHFKHFWNCKPEVLVNAVLHVFQHEIDEAGVQHIRKFPSIRGAILHGNFINLIKRLGIDLNLREQLTNQQIGEAFLALEKSMPNGSNAINELRLYAETTKNYLYLILKTFDRL